jgi:drug/metabolite transporter (DMT)-like permease
MQGWLGYALLTVVCWGVYGVFLHNGAMGMQDPVNGRLKAFVMVGVAYFLVAILAPSALLWARGATFTFPSGGLGWSLVAGVVGAVGALGVLLAFGAKGPPAVVMSLVFGLAPIVNALVSTWKAGTWGDIRWQFVVGIAMAATGGGMVSLYRPETPPPRADVSPGTAGQAP